MLSLPIKLTRAQTRFLKKNDLVCVGKGSFDIDTPLFGGICLECHYVNLGAEKVSFIADEKRGNCDTYLYFLPRAEFQRLDLTERKDLIVPHVAKSRAAKPELAPVPKFGHNNVGQVWNRVPPHGGEGSAHLICQTGYGVFRAIALDGCGIGNCASDDDTIPSGSRMIAPTLVDYFKNKLDS